MPRSEAWKQIYELQRRGDTAAASQAIASVGALLSEAERAECVGNQFFLDRNFQEAVNCYERAITIDGTYTIARYHYLVGVQEERKNNFVDAFMRYQNSIEIDPDFVDSYTELGGLLMKVKDFDGAAQCFEDALSKEPDHLGNYQNLVVVYQQLASQDKAKYGASYAEAVERYSQAKKHLASLPSGHRW